MATLHIENTVRNFDDWKAAFDKYEQFRVQHGVQAYRVVRNVSRPNDRNGRSRLREHGAGHDLHRAPEPDMGNAAVTGADDPALHARDLRACLRWSWVGDPLVPCHFDDDPDQRGSLCRTVVRSAPRLVRAGPAAGRPSDGHQVACASK